MILISDQFIYTQSGGFQMESEMSRNSHVANINIKPLSSQVPVFLVAYIHCPWLPISFHFF
jgi:hypothetical protein